MPQAPRQRPHPNRQSARQAYDASRGTAHERGYGVDWQRESRAFRKQQAARGIWKCVYCDFAEHDRVDHGIPPRRLFRTGTPEYVQLFNDQRFWIPCCMNCNTDKGEKLPHELSEPMKSRLLAVFKSRGIVLEKGQFGWPG